MPDAVFAAGDFMAAGVLQAFQRAGVKVPGEVALIGFDDAAFASLLFPALTTIRQLAYHMGRKAAELALLRLAGRTPDSVTFTFSPELIVRGSTHTF